MAKKALSISLVAAMLATSNVPVWAADFSDGTDAGSIIVEEAAEVETFSAAEETPVESGRFVMIDWSILKNVLSVFLNIRHLFYKL